MRQMNVCHQQKMQENSICFCNLAERAETSMVPRPTPGGHSICSFLCPRKQIGQENVEYLWCLWCLNTISHPVQLQCCLTARFEYPIWGLSAISFFFLNVAPLVLFIWLNGPPFLILFISLPRREITGGEVQREQKRRKRDVIKKEEKWGWMQGRGGWILGG